MREEFGLHQRCREVDSFWICLEIDGERQLIDELAVDGYIIKRDAPIKGNSVVGFICFIRTSASLNHSMKLPHLSFSKTDCLHSCIFSMVRANCDMTV